MSGCQLNRRPTTPAIVRFEDVSLHFGDTPALDHVSFAMQAGETRVVLGAAGSGKTMLLKTAVGLVKPDSGHVSLFGQDVTDLKESELFDMRASVGILFQEGGLFDSLTIAENVAYPLLNQQALRSDTGAANWPAAKTVDGACARIACASSNWSIRLKNFPASFPAACAAASASRAPL